LHLLRDDFFCVVNFYSFYRIPFGESGADVYDRVSTFLDTLHRAFESPDFPSTMILVGHGLLNRLFFMRLEDFAFPLL